VQDALQSHKIGYIVSNDNALTSPIPKSNCPAILRDVKIDLQPCGEMDQALYFKGYRYNLHADGTMMSVPIDLGWLLMFVLL